jgi:hypothetical protein
MEIQAEREQSKECSGRQIRMLKKGKEEKMVKEYFRYKCDQFQEFLAGLCENTVENRESLFLIKGALLIVALGAFIFSVVVSVTDGSMGLGFTLIACGFVALGVMFTLDFVQFQVRYKDRLEEDYNTTTMKKENTQPIRMEYRISDLDIQIIAEQRIGRHLTDDEMSSASKMISEGLEKMIHTAIDEAIREDDTCLSHTYAGERYEFTVYASDVGGIEGRFELTARHIESGRTSDITTNNCVIGWFIHPVCEDAEVEDSPFVVNDREKFRALVKHAIETLADNAWVKKYLEPAMDEDRDCGEWEVQQ